MFLFRKLPVVTLLASCAISSGMAQDSHHQIHSNSIWDSIRVDMSHCVVCKNIVTEWFKYKPKIKEEAIRFGSGVVFLQTFYGSYRSIDAKIFRVHAQERNRVFKASLSLTDEEDRDSLCGFCLELRDIVKSGALVDWGEKEDGVVMVIASTDTAIRPRIFNLLSTFPERFGIERLRFNISPISDWPDLDDEPVELKKVEAEYPRGAFEKKIEGRVIVAVLIDEKGKVVNFKVVKSTNEIFNNAAIEAAKQWVFKPAIYKGKPVKFWYNALIDFKIK